VKIVMFWIAAAGVLFLETFRRARADDRDDGVAFFVGSARPLPATALQKRPALASSRSQKRAQIV
jgi:hypothetical protein